jgi:hypothetical protein
MSVQGVDAPAGGLDPAPAPIRVIFVCTGNSEMQVAFDRALKELSIRIHTFLPLVTGRRS